jgi:hypothetical protein
LKRTILKQKVQSLDAELALRRSLCASFAHELETQSLTTGQKVAIAHRWGNARKESHGLQLAMELLERQKEKVGC